VFLHIYAISKSIKVNLYLPVCRLGGVMVSVLAICPKVRGFKAGRGYGLLRAITICFGGEVKPSALCRNIYGLLKITSKCGQRYFEV
jgi:hypothetical protein